MATATLPRTDAPSTALPPNLAAMPRNAVHDLIELLIVELDARDGDPDVEANGDELDGDQGAEDAFMSHSQHMAGPGCAISDPDFAVDDFPIDDMTGGI